MKPTTVPAIALFLLLVNACGDGDRTSCAIAKEHLDQCNAELEAMAPFGSLDFRGLPLTIYDGCSGWNACNADCIKDASCSGMQWALLGGGSDPNRVTPRDAGVFMQCLQVCADRFEHP